ncbi:hypothetical protein [Rhodoferax antarcticus]|uniref:hypothetical protein n=1 Tax=Rhodoferax antarcticus TaxID=81479 RepID=UPI0012EC3080|nr:hypothetical protein [Rhodoferax antarcticus]MCW2310800.1 hypothetical protein [Rhodoferax antarcticus]
MARALKVVGVGPTLIHQDKAHFLDAWGMDAIVYRGDPNPAQTISQQLGQRTVENRGVCRARPIAAAALWHLPASTGGSGAARFQGQSALWKTGRCCVRRPSAKIHLFKYIFESV